MGSILSFVPRKAATSQTDRPSETQASVIIFPGVRYERRAMLEASGVSTISSYVGSSHKKPAPHH